MAAVAVNVYLPGGPSEVRHHGCKNPVLFLKKKPNFAGFGGFIGFFQVL